MSNLVVQKMIIEDESFLWSFSRLKKYDDCKYAWYMKYIENMDEDELFFSQFGSFMHELYYEVLIGNMSTKQMRETYLADFRKKVSAKAPTEKIFIKYFEDGLRAVNGISTFLTEIKTQYEIVGAEVKVDFEIEGKNFVGFIDLLLKDDNGGLIIVDHKSRTLKPRSNRSKPTKSDELLDEYTKQLYIYSEAVYQNYGVYPNELWFNCFRNDENNIIKQGFYHDKFLETKQWIKETIHSIAETERWEPNCDQFFCTNLCGLSDECEYYQMMKENF